MVTSRYAAGDGGDEAPKAFVSVNWLLSESALDMETELALGFLNYLLLGTSASPLRKALNDSGLGESLIGGGLEDELVQPIFSVGLKGVAAEDSAKVESLVMETLARLEKEGFTSTAIEAAINTIEFSLRENNTGRFPRGLSLMLRAMGSWIYDRDPLRPLEVCQWKLRCSTAHAQCDLQCCCYVRCCCHMHWDGCCHGQVQRALSVCCDLSTHGGCCVTVWCAQWIKDLEHFKGRLESGEDVFGPLIRRYLLDNGHRVTVEMLPDTELAAKQEEEERQRLQVGCCRHLSYPLLSTRL